LPSPFWLLYPRSTITSWLFHLFIISNAVQGASFAPLSFVFGALPLVAFGALFVFFSASAL
jgi:hypothetical protein